MSRIEQIKERFKSFKDCGVSWRCTISNPYTSSSNYMQEQGSYHERVMAEFMNNVMQDMEFLLNEHDRASETASKVMDKLDNMIEKLRGPQDEKEE